MAISTILLGIFGISLAEMFIEQSSVSNEFCPNLIGCQGGTNGNFLENIKKILLRNHKGNEGTCNTLHT